MVPWVRSLCNNAVQGEGRRQTPGPQVVLPPTVRQKALYEGHCTHTSACAADAVQAHSLQWAGRSLELRVTKRARNEQQVPREKDREELESASAALVAAHHRSKTVQKGEGVSVSILAKCQTCAS